MVMMMMMMIDDDDYHNNNNNKTKTKITYHDLPLDRPAWKGLSPKYAIIWVDWHAKLYILNRNMLLAYIKYSEIDILQT